MSLSEFDPGGPSASCGSISVRGCSGDGWFSTHAPGAETPPLPIIGLGMPGFAIIEGFEDWVYEENAKTQAYFDKHVRKGDVVITLGAGDVTRACPALIAIRGGTDV